MIADLAIEAICTDCGLSRGQTDAVWHGVATSWVTVVLMARPFSNTLEAWALTLLLFLTIRLSKVCSAGPGAIF